MTTGPRKPDRLTSIEATSDPATGSVPPRRVSRIATSQLTVATVVVGMMFACSVPPEHFETAALIQRAYVKPLHVSPDGSFGHSVALSADGSTFAVGTTGDSSNDPHNPSSSGARSSGAVHVFRRSEASWIEEAYVKPSHIVDDAAFGYSVALSKDGSILAIGAYNELVDGCDDFSGAAYVFARQNGAWSEQKRFGLDLCHNEKFGTSVSLSDDGATLAVGIPGGPVGDDATSDDPMYPGMVHVYLRGDAGWGAPVVVKVPNRSASTGDEFGRSVALSGDGSTLAVGATMDASRADHGGAVYVSTRDAWTTLTRLDASNPDQDDGFGAAVALSRDGSTLAASAYLEDGSGADQKDNLVEQSGAVYVFTRSASAWNAPQYLKASNPDKLDFFGVSVAISQDGAHLVVGADQEDSSSTGVDQDESDNDGTNSGAAYVFANDGGTYRKEAYLKASNTARGEAFGKSVAMSADGSMVVVGAFREGGAVTGVNPAVEVKDNKKEGAAYVFHRIP